MEKIKNILNPGKSQDDEVLYGSGRSSDPVHSGLGGEGSHFGEAKDHTTGINTGTNNPSTTTSGLGSSTTAGPHSSNIANKADPRVDSTTGQSNVPGAYPGDSSTTANPYNSREVDSRVGGTTSTTAGPHSSNIANKADPRVDSDLSGTQHHLGRDAATVGTAGVVGEGVHHKENEHGLGNTSTGTGSHLGTTTGTSTTAGPHSSNLANKADPRVDSDLSSTQHHYGRDAAAIGTAGAVGEGIHHHRENERGLGNTTSGSGAGTYYGGPQGTAVPDVAGPHTTSTANRLDPRTNENSQPIDDASKHHHLTGGGGASADTAHSGKDHHIGRDAAIGAGGVGLAAHEHSKHSHEDNTNLGQTTGSTTNKLQKEPPAGYTGSGSDSREHHLGRDTAGVGAAGVGAYELEKHHKHDKDLTETEREQKREQKHEIKEEKKHQQEIKEEKKQSSGGLFSFLHRDKDKKYTPQEEAEFDRQEREHHSHTGRDAALGGAAVGGAAYEAEKHHGHHSGTTGTHPDTTVETNKPLPVAPGNHGIGTGVGAQNALADRTRGTGTQEHGHLPGSTTSGTEHHYGRDAAAVGAVGGAAGIASHEHNKHEHEQNTSTNVGDHLHGVERNRGVGGGATGTTGTGHHLGRDAAVGAGGGVGLAEHEHRKHEGLGSGTGTYSSNTGTVGVPDEQNKPLGSTIGDKLHGIARNRGAAVAEAAGVEGIATGISTTGTGHHVGRDAAVGAGGVGLAEHEHRKHEGVGSGITGHSSTTGTSTTGTGHHLGRDAAVGAGGVGLAEHEHHKHQGTAGTSSGGIQHSTGQTGRRDENIAYSEPSRHVGTTGSAYPSSATAGTGHHLGRDAAVGAGGVGLAEHEHRKHEGVGSSTTGTGHHLGRDAAVGAGGVGLAEHEHRQHEGIGSSATGTGTGHHLGRDAAVGAGGVGLAEHEHRKHEGVGSHTAGLDERTAEANTSSGYTGTGSNLGTDGNSGVLGTHQVTNNH